MTEQELRKELSNDGHVNPLQIKHMLKAMLKVIDNVNARIDNILKVKSLLEKALK